MEPATLWRESWHTRHFGRWPPARRLLTCGLGGTPNNTAFEPLRSPAERVAAATRHVRVVVDGRTWRLDTREGSMRGTSPEKSAAEQDTMRARSLRRVAGVDSAPVVLPTWDRRMTTLIGCLDRAMRAGAGRRPTD